MSSLARHFPNLLTAIRLVCAPALAFLLVVGADRAALGLFAFAGLSDVVDGYFAKRFGFVTPLGRYLDPAADKLLMFAAFVALTLLGFSPAWLAMIVIGRDAAILAGLLVGHALNLPLRIAPLLIGKISTAVQAFYVGLMMLMLASGFHGQRIADAAAVTTAAATIASWVGYGVVWLKAFASRHQRTA